MDEIFVPIIDFEGLYEISNLGNVKALYREWFCGSSNSKRYSQERLLTKSITNTNYFTVTLRKYKKSYTKTVHRLVWESFNGKTDLDIDHINNIKSDNRLINLQPLNRRNNIVKEKTKKGSYFHKKNKNWISGIYFNGKKYHLGVFNNQEDAEYAYLSALDKINKGIFQIYQQQKEKP